MNTSKGRQWIAVISAGVIVAAGGVGDGLQKTAKLYKLAL
jgi:hypothetical protein